MKIRTIQHEFKGEFKSLNSKFIGILRPFKDKEQLKGILDELKKAHPKANHICWAYRVGYQIIEERASDDGEPSGSAGKPILNQLLSHQLSNAILLVVRYFGGTKLGVSGLIEAYKEAAFNCITSSEIVEEEDMILINLDLVPESYFEFIKKVKKENIEILSTEFEDSKYLIQLKLPKSKEKSIQVWLADWK